LIHKRCSGVSGEVQNVAGFCSKKCFNEQLFVEVVAKKKTKISLLDKVECLDKFCYLGYLISAGRGAKESSRPRVRCALAEFDWLPC